MSPRLVVHVHVFAQRHNHYHLLLNYDPDNFNTIRFWDISCLGIFFRKSVTFIKI